MCVATMEGARRESEWHLICTVIVYQRLAYFSVIMYIIYRD